MPNASLARLIPIIVRRFAADERNSIFHAQFVKFAAAALPVPELQAKLLEILVPTIVNVTQLADWRKNAGKVAFWMQIGEMVDGQVKKSSPAWASFRAGPLKKWATRLEEAAKEGVPLTGPPKINDDVLAPGATPEAANPGVPKSAPLDVPKSAAFDVPGSATGAVEFGEFPAFDEPKNEPAKFGSGGFAAADDGKKPEEEIEFGEFPAFDDPENEAPKFGSGGFGAADDDEKKPPTEIVFAEFPAFDEPEDGAPKLEGAGFEAADDAKKPGEDADQKKAAVVDAPAPKAPEGGTMCRTRHSWGCWGIPAGSTRGRRPLSSSDRRRGLRPRKRRSAS